MKFLCVLMKPNCAYVLCFLYVLTGWLTFMIIPCCSYCARYRSKKNGVMSVIILDSGMYVVRNGIATSFSTSHLGNSIFSVFEESAH